SFDKLRTDGVGMAESRTWTAALVVIGDEILSGRTQDKNVAQVALWLNQHGIRLAEVRIVPDEIGRIAETVNALRVAHDYLFTTGGIGPTHDDITVDAMAEAFGVPVVIHPHGRKILEDYYRDRPGDYRRARAGKRRRRPAAGDRGGEPRRRDRQLSVFQGGPLRRQFRDPVGRQRAGEAHRRRAVVEAARSGLRTGRRRNLALRE